MTRCFRPQSSARPQKTRWLIALPLLGLAGLLSVSQLQAANLSWSGAGADGNWNDSANWGFVGTPANGDTLIFPASQPRMVNTNNIAGLVLNQIRFVGAGGGYDLRGNSFTLTNNIEATNSVGANTIENNITLAGADQIVDVTASLEFDGDLSGNVGVVKNGPGTLIYFGEANPYTGTTTVNAGALILNIGGIDTAFAGPLVINAGTVTALFLEELPVNQPVTINNSGILDLSSAQQTLGTNLTLNGNASVLNGNPLILSSNATVTASPGVLQNCTISGALNVNSNASSTCTFNVASGVNAGSLVIPATISGAATINKLGAGSMGLSASNSFSGQLNIAAGTLVISSPFALGSTGGGTTVSNTATLQIDNSVTNEPLTIASSGKGLINAVGANTWVGNIVLAAQTTMEIDGSSLNLQGTISGSGGFTKTGLGSLRLTSGGNTYAGDTTVNSGVLELNGFNVIRFGTLTIGDGLGGLNADVVRYVAAGGIYGGPGGNTVVIKASGLLDLNGFFDDVGPITLDGGTINTGTGTLDLFPPLMTLASNNATNGDASVNGNLSLIESGTNVISVFNTLRINAVVSGPVGDNLTKTGTGILVLNGTNTYAGPTILQQGVTWAQTPTALGSSASGTVVSNGATLVLSGNITVTNESLTLNGPGFPTWASLDNEGAETNIWTGPITLAASSSIGNIQNAGLIRVTGAISGPGGFDQFYNSGTVSLEGSSANTYTGLTTVNLGATLLLSKSVLDGAIPGNIDVFGILRLQGNNQIANSADMNLESGSLFDTGVFNDGIDTLHGLGNITFGAGGYLDAGNNNGSSTYDGVMSGIGFAGFTFANFGAGTITLNSNQTFTVGTLRALAGKLVINGSQPQIPADAFGGTIGGSGTVGTLTINSGAVSPGSSPGILTSSNVTFTSAANLTVELTGPNPGAGGYDQLNVRGTVALANATLTVIPAFTSPVGVGQVFTIINNDLSDPVSGVFSGLPEGSGFSVNNFGFKISYVGGTGNDVTLTLTNVPAASAGYSVSLGNGSGGIDPNECNYLTLVVSNKIGVPLTNVSATLFSATPNVSVTQPISPYPDIPANGLATNTIQFQISTTTNFVCGSNINLTLGLATASRGSFSFPVVLSSGSPSPSPARYDVSVITNIPDIGTIESTNVVSGFSGSLAKVGVSLWLTHPVDSDLTISLVSPSGAIVTLVSGTGSGANFGSGCSPDASRTTFDDSAPISITAGSPPFVGTFRPQGSLASFINTTANGNWRLRITDSVGGSVGALRCWSLFLYPTVCPAGGGLCELCPNAIITGALGPGSPTQTNFLLEVGGASACGSPKTCPGNGAGGPFPSDNYIFRNGPSNACVTVTVEEGSSTAQMLAAVYLGNYDPANPDKCVNYVADGGFVISSVNPTQSFSFTAVSNGVYVVNVISSSPLILTPYKLTVSGGDCRPVLNITPAGASQVQLAWTTAAANFALEETNHLVVGATNWPPVTNVPIVINSKYVVTNSAPLGSEFYRLHKP